MTRVHPTPPRRRPKKLRRLPHIFEKVLELPFHSDADVAVEETVRSFRFVVSTAEIESGDVRAETVEIYPGVTKIVIRGFCGADFDGFESELEVDTWRFRLPESTRPDMATAAYGEGELVVTVPKEEEEERERGDGFGDGRLVLVQ